MGLLEGQGEVNMCVTCSIVAHPGTMERWRRELLSLLLGDCNNNPGSKRSGFSVGEIF